MSVLIKGMEMPETCDKCPLHHYHSAGKYVCEATPMFYPWNLANTKGIRKEWCPLVELPAQHGRLIDADALITTFCEWGTRLERSRKLVITMCEAKQAIVVIVEDATTIIEAEVSE